MCIKGSCCAELNACQANPDCVSLFTCAANCMDDPCVQMCAAQYPNGVDTLVPFLQCAQDGCSTDCM
jgi:hypothetical protein